MASYSLDVLYSSLQSIREDISEIKSDVAVLKSNQQKNSEEIKENQECTKKLVSYLEQGKGVAWASIRFGAAIAGAIAFIITVFKYFNWHIAT